MYLATVSTHLLPGIQSLATVHHQAGQQPDNLCGAYWVAILLQWAGFTVTTEQVAQQAGSILPLGNPVNWLPQGAVSRQDYALPLPVTDCLAEAGTSAQGLIYAVEQITSGAYCLLPLQADWTADRVMALLHLCQSQPTWQAIPLCNLKTGHLWGASVTPAEATAYLNGQPIEPPPADWNVGHFLTLAGRMTGSAQTLILVCDTYPHFGLQGYHGQPPQNIAQALNRGDGYGGGILLFSHSRNNEEMVQQAEAIGLQVAVWDNGSVFKKKSD